MKIKALSRLAGRTLDYFIFYFTVTFFFKVIGIPLSAFGAILFSLLLPLFFIPVEAVMLKAFGATLGYKLFGVEVANKEGKRLSWKTALKRSLLLGIKIFSPVNLLYPILFLAKKSESQFDRIHEIQIIPKSRRVVIGTVLLMTCFTGWLFEEQLFENPKTVMSMFGGNKDWYHLTHTDGSFAVDFPKNPKFSQRPLPIPGKKPLDYSEYIHEEGDFTYSVSYSKLPNSWLQWGNGLLLKGAIKAIAAHLPHTEIVSKKTVKYQNLSGLNFTMHQAGDREIKGRLLVRDRILYKIEVSYPIAKRDHMQEKISAFINSFNTDTDQISAALAEVEEEITPSLN
ncbi:MAG: RDD family protein [Candidatus Algichlamydia australiensis]|nr:RDD family protein [Chlamydiales bacterium]